MNNKFEKVKKQEGITLIALIITIIIMIILAAVAIAIAINGGLFDQASEASIQTDRLSTIEKIQTAITGEIIEKKSDIVVQDVKDILDIYTSDYTDDPEINYETGIITFPGILKTLSGNEFTLEDMSIWNTANKTEAHLLVNVANIGDYVEYDISYSNVTVDGDSVKSGIGTGWRVLSKNETAGTVKIIPAGTPMLEDDLENINNLLDSSMATNISNIALEDIQEMCTQSLITCSAYDYYTYRISADVDNLLYNGTIIRTNTTATDPYGNTGKMWLYSSGNTLILEYYTGNGDTHNKIYGIRPVVTLKTDIVTNSGDGSSSNPYNMYFE